MRYRLTASAAATALVAAFGPAAAPSQAVGQSVELERAGRLDQAAALYLAAARADPTSLPALLGLERVLPRLGRLPELLPIAQRAVGLEPSNGELQGLLVRLYVALNEPDSARAAARSWARAWPHDATPYREWALALEELGEYAAAREVLLAGREALGPPTLFAVEVAQVRERLGEWDAATEEWAAAVTARPAEGTNAAAQLVDVPPARRGAVTTILTRGGASVPDRRLAAALLMSWGDPERAWTTFEGTVNPHSPDTPYALRNFADLAPTTATPGAWRVRGLALSRFADLAPEPLAVRARADAARAFLEAGDPAAAQAQLARVAGDSAAPLDAQQLAQATLIRALIQAGALDSAGAEMAHSGDRLLIDDRAALRVALARARIRRGELVQADAALADDSSLEALATHGWIALYRGDLQTARGLFRSAGPYAGDRRDATERMAILALVQRIPEDRSPALGNALLALARGDSGQAVTDLRELADQLTPPGGRPEVLLLAGNVAAHRGADGEREAAAFFEEVVRTGDGGAAPPAAELGWAQLLLRQGRVTEAAQHLEHLILNYPESAVVPEARRELERVKGAIPHS